MFESAPAGASLRVRVSPGASRDAILGRHGDALKVSVRSPPEKGRANRDVVRLVAGALGVRPRDVEVARGAASRDKTLLFRGHDAAALQARLDLLIC